MSKAERIECENVINKKFIEDYWTDRADGFARTRKEELLNGKSEVWIKELTEQLPKNRKLRILDVGCGTGFFTVLLAKLGHNVTGVDLTEKMIKKGKRLAWEEGVQPQFLVMDAENLDFEEAAFDVVITRNLTWNLPNPKEAYMEWIRVLKPSGTLLNYDAEHAKAGEHLETQTLHQNIKPEIIKKCRQMYQELPMSGYDRPAWDLELLNQMGLKCQTDTNIMKEIFRDKEEAPIFRIKAVK